MQSETRLENCVCGDCFQENASIQSLIAAVNLTHPAPGQLEKIAQEIARLQTDLETLERSKRQAGSNIYDDSIEKAITDLQTRQAASDKLCHDTHCSHTHIVQFARKHEKGCTRTKYMDFILCNSARGDDWDPRKSQKCVKGECNTCGFKNKVTVALAKCKALERLTEFPYSEFSRVPSYDKPPDAVKEAIKCSVAAQTAVTSLSGVSLTDATFTQAQEACIAAIKKLRSARTKQTASSRKLERKQLLCRRRR
jgi:hypothetical protein